MKTTMRNIIAYVVAILLATINVGGGEGVIGMNWGRQNAEQLIPSMVVDLLLQNGIKAARVYSSHEDILKALSGSGIDLCVKESLVTKMIKRAKRGRKSEKYSKFSLPAMGSQSHFSSTISYCSPRSWDRSPTFPLQSDTAVRESEQKCSSVHATLRAGNYTLGNGSAVRDTKKRRSLLIAQGKGILTHHIYTCKRNPGYTF